MMAKKILLPALLFLLSACTYETYTPGEGKYSNLRADFVETRTNAAGELFCAVTDNGDSLVLSPKRTAKWATTPDSIYRALLYYNVPEKGNEVMPVFITSIIVPKLYKKENVKEPKTDPLKFRSAWMSRGGRYLNLRLAVKTGIKDGLDAKQMIGVMYDDVTTDAKGHKHYKLTLLHNQNGVPEYYSTEVFLSIAGYRLPAAPKAGDEITISINTYEGTTTRAFIY